jgi:predicted transcriptional regulator
MEASAPGSAGMVPNFNGRAADKLVELSASLVGAYVSHNALSAGDLPKLIALRRSRPHPNSSRQSR